MNDDTLRWDSTLDRLQTGVERAEDALDRGDVLSVDPWSPPPELGPMPETVRMRATSLSWRMAAVEQRVRDRRDALRAALEDLGRRREAGVAYAAAGSRIDEAR